MGTDYPLYTVASCPSSSEGSSVFMRKQFLHKLWKKFAELFFAGSKYRVATNR